MLQILILILRLNWNGNFILKNKFFAKIKSKQLLTLLMAIWWAWEPNPSVVFTTWWVYVCLVVVTLSNCMLSLMRTIFLHHWLHGWKYLKFCGLYWNISQTTVYEAWIKHNNHAQRNYRAESGSILNVHITIQAEHLLELPFSGAS